MTPAFFTTAMLCMVFLITSGVHCKYHKGRGSGQITCGTNFTDDSGKISYNNGSSESYPPDKPCEWHIEGSKNGTIFLVFDLYMLEDDKISIDGVPLTTLSKTGLTPYLTDETALTISVVSTKVDDSQRSLRIHYFTNSACNFIFNQSTALVHSVLYDFQKITGLPKTCNFTIIPSGKALNSLSLWLKDFNYTSNTLTVIGSEQHDGTFNAANFSNTEFLSQKQLIMQVTINNNTQDPESFVAYLDEVSAECAETQKLTEGGLPYVVKTPVDRQRFIAANQQSLNCRWLIEAPEGKTITVSVDTTSVTSSMDQIIVLDGPNRFSPVLLDINAASTTKQPMLFSTGKYLWISISSPFFNESFNVKMTADITTSGGHMRDKGNVSVQGDSTYLLEVESGKQLQFVRDKTCSLKDQAVLEFYQDFTLSGEPFYKMSAGSKMDVAVVSPTEKMALVSKSFKSPSAFSGSFVAIEQGCYKYGQASGDTFSVTGHCDNTCAWIIKPVASSLDLLTFHFNTLNLDDNDHVLIQQLDANQTKIANLTSGQSSFPDLWLSAANGAFVQVNRGNCSVNKTNSVVIQSSYQVIPGCETILRPKAGETVSFTSPGYPNNYPLGSNCSWVVVKPANVSIFLVSFKDIQLAQKDHSLKIFANMDINVTLIAEYNGTNFNSTDRMLPDDIPINGSIMVNFVTNTLAPLDSRPGFSMSILAVEYGGLITNSTGKVETPGFPKPINNSALYAWMVDVNSPSEAKQILEYAFSNQTNETGIEQVLKVYNGPSLRSEVLANFSDSEMLSRYNKLLFVYQKTASGPSPGFSVSYHNFSCNMSMICNNGVCMHEDWLCNGNNDCGDFSDERNCEGGYVPPPAPTPSPTPSPSEGSKGVSSGVLAGGVVASLVIGAILGGLGKFALDHYKNRRSPYNMLDNP